MSTTTRRSESTASMDARLGETADVLRSTDQNRLEVLITPAGAANPAHNIISIEFEKGIATWAIDRAHASDCLSHMLDWTAQGLVGSNGTVASVDGALIGRTLDTEAPPPRAREMTSPHPTHTGHTHGT